MSWTEQTWSEDVSTDTYRVVRILGVTFCQHPKLGWEAQMTWCGCRNETLKLECSRGNTGGGTRRVLLSIAHHRCARK